MGATYMAETYPGSTGDEAHAAMLAHFRAEGYTDVEADNWDDHDPTPWPDPFGKGWQQVWDKPVTDLAIASMRDGRRSTPRASTLTTSGDRGWHSRSSRAAGISSAGSTRDVHT